MPHKCKQAKPILGAPKKKTPSATQRGYDTTHRKLRAVLLKTYPLCQHRGKQCTGWSAEAHHKVYPARSLSDYEAVCHACHVELEREKSDTRMGTEN